MQCSSGTACGGIADFFLRHGAIHAATTGPLKWKVGVVCIPANFCCSCCYLGLLSTATEFSKMPATVMRNNYEKLVSSCVRLWKAPCSDLCCMVLCNQKHCSFLSSSLSPPGGTYQSAVARVWKWPEPVFIHLTPWLFFSRNKTKMAEKNENAPQVWIHTCHLSHAELHIICCCLTADMDS